MEKESGSKPFWESLPAKAVPVYLGKKTPPTDQEPATVSSASTGCSYDDGIDRTGPKVPPDRLDEVQLRLRR